MKRIINPEVVACPRPIQVMLQSLKSDRTTGQLRPAHLGRTRRTGAASMSLLRRRPSRCCRTSFWLAYVAARACGTVRQARATTCEILVLYQERAHRNPGARSAYKSRIISKRSDSGSRSAIIRLKLSSPFHAGQANNLRTLCTALSCQRLRRLWRRFRDCRASAYTTSCERRIS